jgi:hypothetical protein
LVRWEVKCLLLVAFAGLFLSFSEGVSQPVIAKETVKPADKYSKEIVRSKNKVTVSRVFVDTVEKNDAIVLSSVAVRQRVDKHGRLEAWELVEIDRGSLVAKMGFRPGDRVTSVNGIPVRALETRRTELAMSSRWELLVYRHGKPRRVVIEVRE